MLRLSKWVGILWLAGETLAPSTAVLAQRAAIPRYSVTDLGTLGGASEAAGVNNLGDVVGASRTTDGQLHAFLYRNGRLLDLGTLTGGTSS